jgi:hypothetical protein
MAKHVSTRDDAVRESQRIKEQVDNPPEESGPVTIELKEEFTFNGAHYGPGVVDAPDQDTADALLAAQDRLDKSPSRRLPVATVHGVVSGIDPATAPRGVLVPADVEKQVAYANENAPTGEEGGEGEADTGGAEGETTAPRTRRRGKENGE